MSPHRAVGWASALLMPGALAAGSLEAQGQARPSDSDVRWLEAVRPLAAVQHPEWSEADLDSAYATWVQWLEFVAPREAAALTWLSPDQQFGLERYQAMFGWPKDSTEWRALKLSGIQREALQYLFHRPRNRGSSRALPPVDPALAAAWSFSNGSGRNQPYLPHSAGLQGPAARAHAEFGSALRSSLRSPTDYPVQLWVAPQSVALGYRPQLARTSPRHQRLVPQSLKPQGRSPRLLPERWHSPLLQAQRSIDRVVLAMDSSGGVLADLSGRLPHVQWSLGTSTRRWFEAKGSWYGPGGLLLSVQREGNLSSKSGARPPAGATPWRPQRGNRATAALPLWGGRLTLQQTSLGRSAAWTDARRSALWYPGQLAAFYRWTPLKLSDASIRLGLYAGRAQGISVQGRWLWGAQVAEWAVAGITSTEAVLPRATGPMALWRPGWTSEASWTFRRRAQQASVRFRRSPSGWSVGLRLQIPLGTPNVNPEAP